MRFLPNALAIPDELLEARDQGNVVFLCGAGVSQPTQPGFAKLAQLVADDFGARAIEFSRVSRSRDGALTLVIDPENGDTCRIAYAISKRRDPEEAVCDLQCREDTTRENIGCYFSDGSKSQASNPATLETIKAWAAAKGFDVVVWTDLGSNFAARSRPRKTFTVQNAIAHLEALGADGKAQAKMYVGSAPSFVDTQLRRALQAQEWLKQ